MVLTKMVPNASTFDFLEFLLDIPANKSKLLDVTTNILSTSLSIFPSADQLQSILHKANLIFVNKNNIQKVNKNLMHVFL